METEISKLAEVLRENGAEVLNGTSKLTLSSDLLNTLNSSFGLVIDQRDAMSSSFHVINSNNTRLEEYKDLQFLHDFIQRVVSLKLTPTNERQEFTDVTKFKNLRFLEVYKIDIKSLLGIQGLRLQLQYLVCLRSIGLLNEVLEKCGGDESAAFVWGELKEAVFSHNCLQFIDESLMLAPSLHTLDLSHNEIKDATPLNCLSNLKHLNIGYNKLNRIPDFNGQLCNRLQVLVVRNNFIEDLNELAVLSNLCELDLSDNCLIEHNSLVPLANLATLQCLHLTGNPLSYHPQHRTRTSSYLHNNTGTFRFLLDRIVLSKSEQRLVGSLHPRTLQRPISIQSTSHADSLSEKPRRIRHATISDTEHSPLMEDSMASVASLLTSGEHLETKRQIEELHEKYGEKWLHSEAASLVQDVLGLERTPVPMSSTPYGSADILIHAEIKPRIIPDRREISEVKSDHTTENFVTAPETMSPENSMYANEVIEDTSNDDDELGEGEENIYLTTIKGETDPVFVVITKTHILEKDCTNTTERTRWPIETLLSCEVNDVFVHLNFDTVRNDRRERQYILEEEEESQRFSKTLSAIVANRPPEPLILYKCLKCSSQFSMEKNKKNNDEKMPCPTCGSTLVFEEDG